MVRTNTESASPPSSHSPGPDDWDRIRSCFEELYVKQDWHLSEVMEELEKHDFFASVSAFKRKITKWKLDKKKKEAEMLAIIRKSIEIESQGGQRRYRIRNKEVTRDDAYHYFERKGTKRELWKYRVIPYSITPEDVKSFVSSEVGTPFTPSTTSTSSQLESAGQLLSDVVQSQVVEEFLSAVVHHYTSLSAAPSPTYLDTASTNFLHSIEYYYPSNFFSGNWILGTVEHDDESLYPSMQFGSLFLKYHNMRDLKNYPEAQLTLRSAFGMVETLLRVQDPRLLIYFLESLAFCRAHGYHELADSFNVFFMAQAKRLLGLYDPITVFCAGLLHKDQSTRDGFVELGLKCMLFQFRKYLQPPYDLETMRLLLTGAMILKHQESYGAAAEFLDQLLPMYHHYYGQQSCQTVQCVIDKAHVILSQKSYLDTESLIVHAMKCAEGIEDAKEAAESRIRCLVCLAVLREMEGDASEKKIQLKKALAIGKEIPLEDDHWAMRDVQARLSAS